MVLDPVFCQAFSGIARSGNVSALVNPLLPPERLAHVLRVSGARVAVVSPAMVPVLTAVRDRLGDLAHLVLTHREPDLDGEAAELPTVAELAAGAPAFTPPVEADGEEVACLQFTSGTTGAAKAVRLTHRNLTVNAAQTAHMHQVDESSVLFNHLPTLHLMHVTVAATVGATHVLWPAPDVAEAVIAADIARATHYYSLPMRLAKLAADPRLGELEAPALRAILSGGSALAPSAAGVLSQHFGVPVVQGYGLAETSPTTHLSDLDRPRPGSCGVLVPGAESRIVDPETGPRCRSTHGARSRCGDRSSCSATSGATCPTMSTRTAGSPPGTSATRTPQGTFSWSTGSRTSSSATTGWCHRRRSNGSCSGTVPSPTASSWTHRTS
ncbi:hypothetical protein GCM10010524_39340 [Streptomyces mexicanus]